MFMCRRIMILGSTHMGDLQIVDSSFSAEINAPLDDIDIAN